MGALDLMFQHGMNASGSMALGQQLGVDQQTSQANLQSMMLANQSNAELNPLRAQLMQSQIQGSDLNNQTTQAALPGVTANSSMLGTKADIETKTAAAQVAQRLSSLNNQIGVDGVQKMGRDGAIALQASQALAQYPPALHKEVFQKLVQQYGGDPNSPTFQGLYNMPDGQFQKAAATIGQGMVMNSGEYLQKAALNKDEYASRERIASGNNAATIESARISAQSRVEAAEKKANMMMNHMTLNQKQAYLSDLIAQGTATDGEKQQYQDIQNKIKEQRAAGINPLPANMIGQPTPVQQAGSSGGFGASQPGPNNTGAVTAPQQIQSMAQQSWGTYEPDKYEYRVGPNGNLQRKPK